MNPVGIRSLQQNASRIVKRVASGEVVEVTDRGRRVAWLVPASRGESLLEALEATGRLERAEADVLGLGEPIRPSRRAESPSQRLSRMRSYER